MTSQLLRPTGLFALTILFSLSVSAQGLHWKCTTKAMGAEMNNEFFFMPKMVKTVSDDGEVMLLRVDRKMIYTVYPAEKQYSATTFDEFDALMGTMVRRSKAAADRMKVQLKTMPENQRKMVEHMLEHSGKEEPAATKKTDDVKTIAGYPCAKYVITQGEKELMTVWATEEVKEFAAMRKDFEEFSKRMMGRTPGMGGAAEELMKLPGFAMETQYGSKMMQAITGLERMNTPSSEFEVPAGYAKVKSKWQEQLDVSDAASTKQP
jgi:hypothetical protein